MGSRLLGERPRLGAGASGRVTTHGISSNNLITNGSEACQRSSSPRHSGVSSAFNASRCSAALRGELHVVAGRPELREFCSTASPVHRRTSSTPNFRFDGSSRDKDLEAQAQECAEGHGQGLEPAAGEDAVAREPGVESVTRQQADAGARQDVP